MPCVVKDTREFSTINVDERRLLYKRTYDGANDNIIGYSLSTLSEVKCLLLSLSVYQFRRISFQPGGMTEGDSENPKTTISETELPSHPTHLICRFPLIVSWEWKERVEPLDLFSGGEWSSRYYTSSRPT